MKWITKDCYGNTKTWYSGDVIEKIKEITKKYDAKVGTTIIANPIQDLYDIYIMLNEADK